MYQKIELNYEDFQRATGYERPLRVEMDICKAKMSFDDGYESEDLISVQSIDEDIIRQEFEEIKYANELIKGATKAEPIEGDYEELNIQIEGANKLKGHAPESFDENFDEMMVDEGVSATN